MTQEEMVREFHNLLDVSPTMSLPSIKIHFLETVARLLDKYATQLLTLYKSSEDQRYLRAHLLLEEMSEVLSAMSDGDELELLDGLADLQYVLVGTAVTFDLPLSAAFEEVHRSNMTKTKQPDDPDKDRVRSKGPRYSPPNLKAVLERHRG